MALLAGYGASYGGEQLLGPGAGVRAGYRLQFGLYLGVLALAHHGSEDPWDPGVRFWAHGVRGEVGYQFDLPVVALRPSLRAGAAWVKDRGEGGDPFVSPEVGLGFTVLVPIERWFVGADADGRFFTRIVNHGHTSHGNASVAGYVTAGYQF